MDLEKANLKCRNAGVAACVQGVISFAFICYAVFSGESSDDPTIQFFNDPYLFVDIVIVFALAGGLFIKSRTAAVLLLVYFIASKVIFIAETGKFSGIGLSLVFIYLYVQGIVGAFAHTRLRREADPAYRKKPVWLIVIAGAGLFLLTAFMGLGVFMTVVDSPATAVESGEDLSESELQWLRENGVIAAGEKVDLFYSYGILSISEGGSLLTDKHAISYFNSAESELEVHFARYDEIISITLQEKGGILTDAEVEVVYGSEDDQGWFYLVLSVEGGGDKRVIELLEKRTGLSIGYPVDQSE